MSEKIDSNQSNQDISLGYYGKFETMPVMGALSQYKSLLVSGRDTFNSSPDRMQIMNTVARATDAEINAWASQMSRVKSLSDIGFYVEQAKGFRKEAQQVLEIEPKKHKPQ